MLLALDMSEVRKIVRIAKSVEEYVMLCETVESMEQLVEFVKVSFRVRYVLYV